MVRIKKILVFCCLMSLANSLEAQPQSGQGHSVVAVPEILLASSVAYRDFDNQLKAWERKWKAGGRAESKTQQYASNIRNYTIQMYVQEGKVYVSFSLRPFAGAPIFGGISRYVIDEKTAIILEHTGEK